MNRIGRFQGALLGLLLLGTAMPAMAQGDCVNTTQYPGNLTTPAANGTVTTISTCSYEQEYSIVTGVITGAPYQFTLSTGGYITVHQGAFDGTIIGQGFSPVDVIAADATDIFAHWNVDDLCTQLGGICDTTTVQLVLDCTPVEATATFTEDCDQQIFYVTVDVTSLGDGASVNVVWDVFGNIQSLPAVGIGSYQLGPFFFGEEAVVWVEHENDFLCNLQLGTFMTSGDCPVQVTCGTGPMSFGYCYTNNETQVWNFSSIGGSGSLVMTFFTGTLDASFNDTFVIYDGTDATGTVLYQHTGAFGTDLAGLVVVSTTGAFHMELVTNGFNSCDDGALTAWSWQVECLNCVLPQASAINVDDCLNNQFSIPVTITTTGDATTVTIAYSLNGGAPQTITGVSIGETVLGPFTINDVVSVFVLHEFDPACTVSLGVITDSGDCPNLITCGSPALVETYCYVANDLQDWSYQSVGAGTLRLTFNIGTIESHNYEDLRIYDGIDATGTLVFEHLQFESYNLGPAGSAINGVDYPYYGIQIYSTTGNLYMEMSSDGSVQCGDPFPTESYDSWEWEVVCLDCSIPVADVTIVDDCAANTFTLDVDITSTGSGSTAALDYTLNGTPQTSLTGLPVGITTMGPFAFGDQVDLILAHETNSLCNIPLGVFSDTGTCPLLIPCDGTQVSDSACYANNDDLRWYYQGTGTYPLGIFFVSGDYEYQDSIFVYDGGDITAPLLFSGGNFPLDMTGQFFYTTNPEHRLCVRIKSNTFTSCAEGFVGAQTEWQIACLDCVPPVATFAIAQDCDNFQYFIDVVVTDMGTDPEPVITNTAGLPPTSITAVGTYQVGPFTSGTQVQLTIENDANSLCNIYSGTMVNPLCPTVLCGSSPLIQTYCYIDGDNHAWAYSTPDGSGTIHLLFNRGTIESNTFDDLNIYDGPDGSGTLLFTHGGTSANLGPTGSAVLGAGYGYETVDVVTTGPNIYMTLTSDGSVSCSGTPTIFDPWEFQVICQGCSAPGIAYNLVADCLHREYKTEVIVTAPPSPLGLTVTNTETGEIQTASSVGILYFGPYGTDSLSLYSVVDGSSASCIWMSDSLTYPSDSCHIVSCGFDNYEYCYENDEDRWYTYQSAQPVPTTIAFSQGQLLSGDRIVIYNGPDENSSVIYQGTNGGNLTGFAVNSQNPLNVITLRIQSNAAGSCEDGQATSPLMWYVGCGAVGIEEVAADGFAVYPNPTEGTLYINVGKAVSGSVKVRVLDMSGRTVMERPMSIAAGSTNSIEMAGLQSGQYMVQLTTNQWTKTQRVQVAR